MNMKKKSNITKYLMAIGLYSSVVVLLEDTTRGLESKQNHALCQ